MGKNYKTVIITQNVFYTVFTHIHTVYNMVYIIKYNHCIVLYCSKWSYAKAETELKNY